MTPSRKRRAWKAWATFAVPAKNNDPISVYFTRIDANEAAARWYSPKAVVVRVEIREIRPLAKKGRRGK